MPNTPAPCSFETLSTKLSVVVTLFRYEVPGEDDQEDGEEAGAGEQAEEDDGLTGQEWSFALRYAVKFHLNKIYKQLFFVASLICSKFSHV